VSSFDLIVSGGMLVDGTGAPARRADVGVVGDRIVAVGDLAAAAAGDVAAAEVGAIAARIDARDRVVAPGFVDVHAHSDTSVLVDGALASHLRQGYTTQLSGNCGDTLAPLGDRSRGRIEHLLEPYGLRTRWTTFGEYLDAVERTALGLNVAFLVGHGTIRETIVGGEARPADPEEVRAMSRLVEDALDAGAFGLSSGLIYRPGIHAAAAELAALARVAGRRGALYASHIRNEAAGLLDAVREAIEAARASGARLQVSHLKAGAVAAWGLVDGAVALLDAARAEGLDVGADQYPYTAASTGLDTILPPEMLAGEPAVEAARLREPAVRDRVRRAIAEGRPGWENAAADPGWPNLIVAESRSHPGLAGRSIAALAEEDGRDPLDVALDLLVDDLLDTSIVEECMSERDVEALLAVPWIGVGTDGEGRRPGHPVLGGGIPHPRSYGTAPRVLGRYVRERRVLALETAVAKLTSVPAERLGLTDRGVVRVGAAADLVVFDPATVADRATFTAPHAYPAGIDAVVVNGTVAVLDGEETGARPGRLLRRS
jgi:dihydroorotase/N-acyl-D-amino-acid deacylase